MGRRPQKLIAREPHGHAGFDGAAGRAAAARVDETMAKLPGFADASLFGRWLVRKVYTAETA